jgi:hypothetical protein
VRSIRVAGGIVLVVVAGTMLAYGSWLLVTADEGDGGREPVGVLSLVIGLLVVVPLLRRRSRSRSR